MSTNGRIINPNNPDIGMHWQPNQLCQSHSLTMQGPGGAQIIAFGGKTLLLDVATQLLCATIQRRQEMGVTPDTPDPIEWCLDMAEALIEGSNKRLSEKKKPAETLG